MSTYGLAVLNEEECRSLLRSQRVGRIALAGANPAVLPVLFTLLDDDVVFSTAPGQKLIAALLHERVAFEVDEIDDTQHGGWSVNVVGPAEEIVHPEELRRVRALSLEPWAGAARDRVVRIRTERISGRRIDRPSEEGVG
jgi:nitroimidazol reductase NimA-like FMN-containing flavoprotein (pyridoxamine 5'-phosphate oxidase superfamily)